MEPKIAPFGAIFIKLSNSQAQQTNQQTCREQQSEANLLRENFVSDHVRMILSKAVAVTVYTSCVSTEGRTTELVQTFSHFGCEFSSDHDGFQQHKEYAQVVK